MKQKNFYERMRAYMESLKVIICRSCGDYAQDEVDAELIDNVHWDKISGGVHKRQSGYSLYGYIPYDMAEKLSIKCSGRHNWGYNDAKVCIQASNNKGEYRKGYNYLVKQAGPKPQSDISIGRPDGQGPCTKKILFLLKEREVVERGELREEIVELGYQRNTFCNAMRALVKQGKIVLIGPPQSCHQKVSLNSNA